MTNIRKMTRDDKNIVIDMMRVFYASPAVLSNGSEEIFEADVENCVNDSPYLEGLIFEDEGEIQGYGMIAKSFSTEFGKPCIWVEDLYMKPEFRGAGIGSQFFDYPWNENGLADCCPRPGADPWPDFPEAEKITKTPCVHQQKHTRGI